MKKEIEVRLVGVVPMLQHNSQLANPMSPAAKALKAASAKGGRGKKTDENYEEIAKAEFFGGLYVDEKSNYFIPEEQIESMICAASFAEVAISKAKSMGSINVLEPFFLVEYDGPLEPEKRYGNFNCMDQRLVSVGTSKIVRTRPMFRNWVAEGSVHYDTPYTEDTIRMVLEACGSKGVGDYRPKFGRFNVEFL
jgi:hypothetical protein